MSNVNYVLEFWNIKSKVKGGDTMKKSPGAIKWNRFTGPAFGCLEVARSASADEVLIRDSKHPKTVVCVDHKAWQIFIAAAKEGKLDAF